MNRARPVLVISMGVSGSGKSTLARALARDFNLRLFEADDFHSEKNKAHMASGRPLTDAMREPWIASMCETLLREKARGHSCVLAYSGLRRAHRQRFRALGFNTLYLHLHGSRALIATRMGRRSDHFMPPGLLDDQFANLQPPENEGDIVQLDINTTETELLARAAQLVRQFIDQ